MIKDKPILMNSEMVKATIDERKNQTRRAIKNCIGDGTKENPLRMDLIKCQFGRIGDLLWVREPFAFPKFFDNEKPCDCNCGTVYSLSSTHINKNNIDKNDIGKLRPSIHMPRFASRITLEITDIDTERLQDISLHDAINEGITPDPCKPARQVFRELWDSIYADSEISWNKNPYVWVVKFKRHMVNIDSFKSDEI